MEPSTVDPFADVLSDECNNCGQCGECDAQQDLNRQITETVARLIRQQAAERRLENNALVPTFSGPSGSIEVRRHAAVPATVTATRPLKSSTSRAALNTAVLAVIAEVVICLPALFGKDATARQHAWKTLPTKLLKTAALGALAPVIARTIERGIRSSAKYLAKLSEFVFKNGRCWGMEVVEESLKKIAGSGIGNAIGGGVVGAVMTAFYETLRIGYYSIRKNARTASTTEKEEAQFAIRKIKGGENVLRHFVSIGATMAVTAVCVETAPAILFSIIAGAIADEVITFIKLRYVGHGSVWSWVSSFFVAEPEKQWWNIPKNVPVQLECHICHDLL
ncbi:hypothetical protein HDV00_007940 [Rhizophlyctis rosea]|nr:hypothetical protein HDV00_007940 [Rhizophlyctis rosea]